MRGLSPRVRGNLRARAGLTTARGLSPRVRGNRVGILQESEIARSIPACAGGTVPGMMIGPDKDGLSPRVRGNHAVG